MSAAREYWRLVSGDMKRLILSDIHGCYHTMLSMIEKHGQGRQLILLGDLIDRGPRSKQVVEYAMDNAIPTVAANHDDLALAYSAHYRLGYRAKCAQYYDRDVWLDNGGDKALASWSTKTLPTKVLDWMSQLPAYIKLDTLTAEGRKVLLSHSGYGLDADKGNWMRTLWGRYPESGAFAYEEGTGNEMDDGYLRVFGHTRNHEVQSGPGFINLDTGCAYTGYGVLSGLLLPEVEVVQVPNID